MDDGFDSERDKPAFASSAQPPQETKVERDKSPVADREKYKAPEMKKNAQLKKGKAADHEKPKSLFPEDDDEEEQTFNQPPRERTFTFSNALAEVNKEEGEEEEEEDNVDIASRKEQLK